MSGVPALIVLFVAGLSSIGIAVSPELVRGSELGRRKRLGYMPSVPPEPRPNTNVQ